MIYELREYIAEPGQLPALIQRFNETTLPLFAKHDMSVVKIGMTSLGESSFGEIVYTLVFDSLEDMSQKWAIFLSDPEWLQAEAASEATGPLLRQLKRRVLDPGPFILT